MVQAWEKNGIDYFWDSCRIYRILRDERYTGRMVARRFVNVTVGSVKMRKAEEHEIIYCDNAHEGIISKEDWENIQVIRQKKEKGKTHDRPNSPLVGILKCGVCKHTLTHIFVKKNPYFKCCTSYRKKECTCKGNRVEEKVILEELLKEIRKKAPTTLHLKALAKGV